MTLEEFVNDALGRGCSQQSLGITRDPDGRPVIALNAKGTTSRFRVDGNRLMFVSSITATPAAIVRRRAEFLSDVNGLPITGP